MRIPTPIRKHRFVKWAVELIPSEFRSNDPRWLISSQHHSDLVSVRRAELILSRARILALLLAVMATVSLACVWLDPRFGEFSALKPALGAAFAGYLLLFFSFEPSTSIGRARFALALLYTLTAILLAGALGWVYRSGGASSAGAVFEFLSILPAAAIASLSIFPLSAIETILLSFLMLVTSAATSRAQLGGFGLATTVGALPFNLIAIWIAALSGISQLSFLIALMGQGVRDPLTQCFTQTGFEEVLELQFVISRRSFSPLTVAFISIDNMRGILDAHGSAAADRVLAQVADRAERILRRGDAVGRWDRREIVIMFPNTTAEKAAIAINRMTSLGIVIGPDGQAVTFNHGLAERVANNANHWTNLVESARDRVTESSLPLPHRDESEIKPS